MLQYIRCATEKRVESFFQSTAEHIRDIYFLLFDTLNKNEPITHSLQVLTRRVGMGDNALTNTQSRSSIYLNTLSDLLQF